MQDLMQKEGKLDLLSIEIYYENEANFKSAE